MKSAPVTLALLAIAIAMAASLARAQHSVSRTWTASTDAAANPSLAYNVYRSPICTGAFAKLNASPLAATNYLDAAVLPGASYFYQVTYVLSGSEGPPSNQAAAVIPSQALEEKSGCTHRGSLAAWLRCVAAIQHAQPKKAKPSP